MSGEVGKKLVTVACGAILLGFGTFCWFQGWNTAGTFSVVFGILALLEAA